MEQADLLIANQNPVIPICHASLQIKYRNQSMPFFAFSESSNREEEQRGTRSPKKKGFGVFLKNDNKDIWSRDELKRLQ